MKIWVDDERPAPEGWTRVYDYNQAITLLQIAFSIEGISLDHDLGPDCDGKTGYDVAKWMVEFLHPERWPRVVMVHSMNPVGRDNIVQLLRRYAPPGTEIS